MDKEREEARAQEVLEQARRLLREHFRRGVILVENFDDGVNGEGETYTNWFGGRGGCIRLLQRFRNLE